MKSAVLNLLFAASTAFAAASAFGRTLGLVPPPSEFPDGESERTIHIPAPGIDSPRNLQIDLTTELHPHSEIEIWFCGDGGDPHGSCILVVGVEENRLFARDGDLRTTDFRETALSGDAASLRVSAALRVGGATVKAADVCGVRDAFLADALSDAALDECRAIRLVARGASVPAATVSTSPIGTAITVL